jgi:hypothetical protein
MLKDHPEFLLLCLQDRKGEKRATLNQLLDDMPKVAKKAAAAAGGSSSTRSSGSSNRAEYEWVVEQLLVHGLLGLEYGFTAYATNTYLVVTAAGEALAAGQGKQR